MKRKGWVETDTNLSYRKKGEEEVSSLIYFGMFTFLPLGLRTDWHIICFEGARTHYLDGCSLPLAQPNPFINVSGGERAWLHITARHIKPSAVDATDRIQADIATATSFFPCTRDELRWVIKLGHLVGISCIVRRPEGAISPIVTFIVWNGRGTQ